MIEHFGLWQFDFTSLIVRTKDINNPKGRWDTRHSKWKLPRDALWAFCEKTKTCGRGFSAERHHLANRPCIWPTSVLQKWACPNVTKHFTSFPFVDRLLPRVTHLPSGLYYLWFLHYYQRCADLLITHPRRKLRSASANSPE
jgi:hypothetical protein